MKRISLICTAFLLMGATAAHADLNGNWGGSMDTTESNGTTGTAPGFSLTISENATSISFSEPGGFTYLDGMVFQVQGSNVLLHNVQIGTLDGTDLNFALLDQIDGIFDQISMHVNDDGTLTYTDHYADYSGDYIDSTSLMSTAAPAKTGPHAPRGQILKNLFDALINKGTN